jgi:D-threo-aldose 1-dehydrogenase
MQFAKRRVGNTKLRVTELGLGTASLAGNVSDVPEAVGRDLVSKAYETGIRYFDTAPFYGYGKSEHLLGDALRQRKDWVISTKVGRLLEPRRVPQTKAELRRSSFPFNPFPFAPRFDYTYDAIMRGYENSLQRLGLNRIDIVYIHDIDVYSQGSKEEQQRVFRLAMDETYRALDKLRSSGEIKAISGTSSCLPAATRCWSRRRSTTSSPRSGSTAPPSWSAVRSTRASWSAARRSTTPRHRRRS